MSTLSSEEPEQWAVKQHIEKYPKCEWLCPHTNLPNLGEEPTPSSVPGETLDNRIDQIIEYWDFSPLQDEDSRIERLRSEMKALINQQIKSVLDELEGEAKTGNKQANNPLGLIREDYIPLSAIQKIRSRYE